MWFDVIQFGYLHNIIAAVSSPVGFHTWSPVVQPGCFKNSVNSVVLLQQQDQNFNLGLVVRVMTKSYACTQSHGTHTRIHTIYVHTHIATYVYTYKQYIRIYIHIPMYIYMYVCIHTYIYT